MLYLSFFIAVILTLVAGYTAWTNKEKRMYRRLLRFLPSEEHQTETRAQPKKEAHMFRAGSNLPMVQFLDRQKTREKTLSLLEQAGLLWDVETLYFRRVAWFLGIAILGLLFNIQWLLALLIGFIGSRIPILVIRRKVKKRQASLSEQLPQALSTISSSLKSGYSFLQAMQLVSKEMPDPIGGEFKKTLRDLNIGIGFEEAFGNLITRMPNEDLKVAVSAVIIQRSTGGNLSQILDTVQETIIERIRIQEELKTLTAQGKMSAWVITLLPVGVGLMLNIMEPDYFHPMFQHPLGWTMVIAGALSGVLGWVIIQKIIRIRA